MSRILTLTWRRAVVVQGCGALSKQYRLNGTRLLSISPVHTRTVNKNNRQFSNSTYKSARNDALESSEHAGTRNESNDNPSTPPPEGNVTIVFTDIVNSTAIWETDVEAMTSAMKIHDDIIRDLTCAHKGYEVKQNGDGFMITFQSAMSALQFCLAVQQRLLDQEWPEKILKLQAGKEASDNEGHVLFKGLRLRMSAHSGTPVCVWNKVTNRLDYLGPVVNRAARFIQITEGGQIVVSEDFLLEIQEAGRNGVSDSVEKPEEGQGSQLDLEVLSSREAQEIVAKQPYEIRLLGKHHFKGLSDEEKLYFIVPESLQGRLDFWPKHEYVAGSKGNIVRGN